MREVQASVYQHQTNGITEVFHRTMKEYFNQYQNDREDQLLEVFLSYCQTDHLSTGVKPFEIVLG